MSTRTGEEGKRVSAARPGGKAGDLPSGDRINGEYLILRKSGRYGLDPGETHYRVGDRVYRVDRDTRKVLDLIGAAAALRN